MTLRRTAQFALMWAIRFTPLPWSWKQRAIHLATPRQIVVGVALIPDDHGQILMLRARYSGRWLAPGGAIHPGEDPLSGARRECREEMGLDADLQRLVGVYTLAGTPLVFLAFAGAPLQRTIRLSPEHETYQYLPPPALPPHLRAMADDMATRPAGEPVVRLLPRFAER